MFIQDMPKLIERRIDEDSFLEDDQREAPAAIVHRRDEFIGLPILFDVVVVVWNS